MPGSSFSCYIDIAAEELKAHEQTEKTEGTWQRKGREPRWTETQNHHNLGGTHRTDQRFERHHQGFRGGQIRRPPLQARHRLVS